METMSRGIVLLAFSTAVGIACERDAVSVLETDIQFYAEQSVVLFPDSTVIQPSEKIQYSARGVTESGDTTPISPTFSATGGRITASGGWYTAGQEEGTFRVIATDPQSGAADTTAVIISRDSTVQPPADTTAPVSAVFLSDWRYSTGNSDSVLRDLGQAIPWDMIAGNGQLNEVIPSAGLDFPTAHVLRVEGGWRSSPAGAAAENPRLEASRGHIPVPEIGQSLYYRWYIRVAMPDTFPGDDLTHPIQDGPNGSLTNWQFEVTTHTNGTWGLSWNVGNGGANAWPHNRWFLTTPLNKNQTYRIELQIHRTGANTFAMHPRVFSSSGALLYSDAQFRNVNSTATLAGNPSFTFLNVATLAGFQAGFNGLNGGVQADYPVLLYYQGGFAISTQGWLGAYRP